MFDLNYVLPCGVLPFAIALIAMLATLPWRHRNLTADAVALRFVAPLAIAGAFFIAWVVRFPPVVSTWKDAINTPLRVIPLAAVLAVVVTLLPQKLWARIVSAAIVSGIVAGAVLYPKVEIKGPTGWTTGQWAEYTAIIAGIGTVLITALGEFERRERSPVLPIVLTVQLLCVALWRVMAGHTLLDDAWQINGLAFATAALIPIVFLRALGGGAMSFGTVLLVMSGSLAITIATAFWTLPNRPVEGLFFQLSPLLACVGQLPGVRRWNGWIRVPLATALGLALALGMTASTYNAYQTEQNKPKPKPTPEDDFYNSHM